MYELKGNIPEKASDGLLRDIFEGYLEPSEYLQYEEDVAEVQDAIMIIEQYMASLEDVVEEM